MPCGIFSIKNADSISICFSRRTQSVTLWNLIRNKRLHFLMMLAPGGKASKLETK
jgi:hypothetical protein